MPETDDTCLFASPLFVNQGRVGIVQDMAGIVLFLTSPAAAHVTGAHIALDGGAQLAGKGFGEPASKL